MQVLETTISLGEIISRFSVEMVMIPFMGEQVILMAAQVMIQLLSQVVGWAITLLTTWMEEKELIHLPLHQLLDLAPLDLRLLERQLPILR